MASNDLFSGDYDEENPDLTETNNCVAPPESGAQRPAAVQEENPDLTETNNCVAPPGGGDEHPAAVQAAVVEGTVVEAAAAGPAKRSVASQRFLMVAVPLWALLSAFLSDCEVACHGTYTWTRNLMIIVLFAFVVEIGVQARSLGGLGPLLREGMMGGTALFFGCRPTLTGADLVLVFFYMIVLAVPLSRPFRVIWVTARWPAFFESIQPHITKRTSHQRGVLALCGLKVLAMQVQFAMYYVIIVGYFAPRSVHYHSYQYYDDYYSSYYDSESATFGYAFSRGFLRMIPVMWVADPVPEGMEDAPWAVAILYALYLACLLSIVRQTVLAIRRGGAVGPGEAPSVVPF